MGNIENVKKTIPTSRKQRITSLMESFFVGIILCGNYFPRIQFLGIHFREREDICED